ncbi:MAG: hypothetical protein RBS27_03625 [Giesbergeria sp.]|jgi:hypothetical protein|nr:hypothetical protein [Giesbergeria sp.]
METPPQSPAGSMASADHPSASSSGCTLAHCLAHAAWTFGYAMAAMYVLDHAEATSDINTWGLRFLWTFAIGLAGSLAIQLSWWGRKRVATVGFWASWLAVTTLCMVVCIPPVMMLFY